MSTGPLKQAGKRDDPLLKLLEPALRGQVVKDQFQRSARDIRALAKVYLRWAEQLFRYADAWEIERMKHAATLERGRWRAANPVRNLQACSATNAR